jgi:spore maturation protein CgeB
VRDRVVSALVNGGIPVSAFGPGWDRGPIDADQVARVFAQSKLILGVGTVAHNRSVYTLKLRDFDATMAGALYVTHRNPDLLRLFEEGTEFECYESDEELLQKVRYYLAHDDERIAVARRGRERALRDHTWDARLDQLFAILSGDATG